jgi:hypothetical protein
MGIVYSSNINKLPILIDDEDIEKVSKFRWYVNEDGYAVRNRSWKETSDTIPLKMHRLILNSLKGSSTDHINGNKLDNRKSNLRICTIAQNNFGRGLKSNNTSGVKGVHLHKPTGKWMVRVAANNKRHYFGLFSSKEEAIGVYNENCKLLHGEFSHLNAI